jgi:ribosomal protein S18 acetylase RimI-like enzyme
MPPIVRPATASDADAIWAILEPHIRAGETYTLPRKMPREQALAWWFAPEHEVFAADLDGVPVGTYFLRPNHPGGGAHVANCGYMTAPRSQGHGVGRAMCAHSLKTARQRGFFAMQFNFVVSTNFHAVALWRSFGFEIAGRLPEAFEHPSMGRVDALVMYRKLNGTRDGIPDETETPAP